MKIIDSEIPKNNIENEPKAPTREEVEFKIREHIAGLIEQKLKIENKPSTEKYDDQGLVMLYFKVREKGVAGYMEYQYMRKGRHENGENGNPNQSSESSIYIIYFDENDIPYNGDGPICVFE